MTLPANGPATGDVPGLEDLSALADRLRGLGYTEVALGRLFGRTPNNIFGAAAPVVATNDDNADPLAVAARVFFTGGGVEVTTADAAFAPLSVADLQAAGIVSTVHERVVGRIVAIPWDGLVLFGDGIQHDGADYVGAATESSIHLAQLVPRRPVASTLDVGTGSGVQALLASRHSDEVVATDVNPRALTWARLNAEVNGVDTIELREGAWFDPAGERSFELVMSNLPYALSPDTTFLYRDGGLRGDELGRMSVNAAAKHLDEGGFAYMLCNWVEHDGEDWAASPRSWVDGTGCDALVLRSTTEDVAGYAYAWLRATNDITTSDADVHRWLEYYRNLGIERIGNGAIVLRRRFDGGSPWIQALDGFLPSIGSQGEQMMDIFCGCDEVRRCPDDDALLSGTYTVAEPASLDQTVMWRDGAVQMGVAEIAAVEGAPFAVDIPADVVHVLLRLDPRDSLDETVEDTADATGIDAAELRQQTAAAARELLTYGLLRPMPH